jgi:hypothetical protein
LADRGGGWRGGLNGIGVLQDGGDDGQLLWIGRREGDYYSFV